MTATFQVTLVSLAAIMVAAPAGAQTFPAAAPVPDLQEATQPGNSAASRASLSGDPGDIVVTARRVEERLQNIPLAISAISGAALQQQGIREIRDLSAVVPNLNIQAGNSGAGAGAAVITIRGQSQTNVIPTVDSSVGLYIDNVNIPRQIAVRDALIDIQRVEVLRGPQGTLYGRNTTGGAVSFYTKDPTNKLGAAVHLSGGNYDAWGIQGILNIPVADGVALRLAGQRSKHDGYGTNVNTPDDSDLLKSDSKYIRGKLKAETGDFKATLTGDYSKLSGGGNIPKLVALNPLVQTGAIPPGGNAAREVALELGLAPSAALLTPANLTQAATVLQSYVNRPGFYDSYGSSPHLSVGQSTSANFNLEWKASDAFSLRSITGYRRVTSDWRADNDGTPFVLSENHQYNRSRFFSEEFQIVGGDKKFNWVTGVFYSTENAFALEENYTFRLLSNNNMGTVRGKIGNDSYAVFGQANYMIVDGLSLTVGARYTKEKRSLVSNNFNTSSGCVLAPAVRDDGVGCLATFKASFSKPTWLASLNYQVTPDVMVYGKASRGFRGGGLNLRGSGTNLALYNPFAPETVTEYEIGVKSELFDRRLRLNLAAFYDDYKDVQRNVLVLINGLTTTLVTNAAKARLSGLEGEAELRATSWLSVTGGFGYLDPKYKSFVDITGDRSGEPWPAPDWNYTFGARLNQSTAIGSLTATVNWAWQDDLTLTTTAPVAIRPLTTQKSYGLLSGRIALTIRDWDAEVALFGRNLTQKHYYTSSIALEPAGFSPLATGEPRTVGFQITKRFGSVD